jgi:thiol:disulfide interchange protein DsbD
MRMRRKGPITAAAALVVGLAGAALAGAGGAGVGSAGVGGAPQATPPRKAEDLVRVRMLADTDIIAAGQTFHIAVVFDIAPHWHVYWKNPGDSGGPTEVRLRGPDGFEIGDALYPRPLVIPDPVGITYGYEERVVLFVPVTAPASLTVGRVTFEAEIDWVVCRKVCLLGQAGAKVSVPTGGHADDGAHEIADPVLRDLFERLPRPIEDLAGSTVRFDRSASRLRVEGPAQDRRSVGFLPIDVPGVECGPPRGAVQGDRFVLEVSVTLNPGNSQGTRPRVSGLLVLGKDEDDPCYDVEFPLPGPG